MSGIHSPGCYCLGRVNDNRALLKRERGRSYHLSYFSVQLRRELAFSTATSIGDIQRHYHLCRILRRLRTPCGLPVRK